MDKIFVRYEWDILRCGGYCVKILCQDIGNIWVRSVFDMEKIWVRYCWNIVEILGRYELDIAKIILNVWVKSRNSLIKIVWRVVGWFLSSLKIDPSRSIRPPACNEWSTPRTSRLQRQKKVNLICRKFNQFHL